MSKSKYIGRYEEYGHPDDSDNKYILDTINGNVYLANKGVWELIISFDVDESIDDKPNNHWKKYRKPQKDE